MRQSIFTILGVLLLSALAIPSSYDRALDERSYSGKGTWFDDGLGACGWTNNDSDPIVALSADMYGSGAYCGKSVNITDTETGIVAGATVADMCPECGAQDLDMSTGLFRKFADLDVGVVYITWDFDQVQGCTP